MFIRRSFWLFIIGFITACANDDIQAVDGVGSFESDLESVKIIDDAAQFETTNPNVFLGGAVNASTDFARSGKQSLRLDSINEFGLNVALTDLQPGEFVQLSVWMKSEFDNPTLTANLLGDEMEYRYRTATDLNILEINGWRNLSLSFVVSSGVQKARINVFSGNKIVYLDDFSLSRSLKAPQNELEHQLVLSISDSSELRLNSFIMTAAKQTTIPAACKKYVDAFIIERNDTANVQMKLKGDWTDHLYSGKESFRVKIKGDLAFQGLKSFSIQHPQTRLFLNEWVIHKIAENEGVLTTTYDFINVVINDVQHGVYALEEHFDKQLLESRNRREGPILKLDETSYWSAMKQAGSLSNMTNFPYFEESSVDCFKSNRTRKSEQLSKQFDEGKKLLKLFKNGHLNIEDIFDIDQLAKFYVIMELSGSGHGLRWHNRRFYYNPITQKLEHIVYDVLPFIRGRNFRCDMADRLAQRSRIRENCFDNAIIYNEQFKEKFFFYLEEKTNPDYLDSVFAGFHEDLMIAEAAIKGEVPAYEFDKSLYYDNAAYLNAIIPDLKLLWNQKVTQKPVLDDWIVKQSYSSSIDAAFLEDLSIHAYRSETDSGYRIQLQNFHTDEIIVHGYGIKDPLVKGVRLAEPIVLNGFTNQPDSAVFYTNIKPKEIFFTASNNQPHVMTKNVLPWVKPKGSTVRMELKRRFKTKSDFYSVLNNVVTFKGHLFIDSLVYIPESYTTRILAGTTIEFKNGGGIIAANSCFAKGNEDFPIRIFCSDSSSNGITILNGDSAVFSYCNFEGLSNLDYGKWELTGAVTVYETSVKIANCEFVGNHSEDALNIVRSSFSINALKISDTYSDGFDADFCTGTLDNATFIRTGNDCIDFSGSNVAIKDVIIENSGDKGISGGEGSTLRISGIQIDGAITGIAAKDGSLIEGGNVDVRNVEYGFAAFRKKPEYDSAVIRLKQVAIDNEIERFLIGLGSTVFIDGEMFEGVEAIDVDALYARFQ